jgi:hypothetical protein
LKILSAVITAVLSGTSTWYYIRWLRQGEATPKLATWLLFAVATVINVGSFAEKSNLDWISGSLGIVDMVSCTAIAIGVFRFVTKQFLFEPIDYFYLALTVLAVILWIAFGSALGANVLAQIIIFIGYFPTYHHILAERKNTEPFPYWLLSLGAGTVALYPSIGGGQPLAIAYSARTVVMVSALLIIMYKYRSRVTSPK